jgi:hypothetical protein
MNDPSNSAGSENHLVVEEPLAKDTPASDTLQGQTPAREITENGGGERHDRHCFIAMAGGHSPGDQRWHRGWYEMVIYPAVKSLGYEPIVSVIENRPNAINDEIREHLAFDPMVVADLGGVEPDSDPNPNVMYELGIRHALDLPVVIMAWRGQRLPFDVGNQRAIIETRDFLSIEPNREMIIAFIRAAETGDYYRPMQAVRRAASFEIASESLSQRSLLRGVVEELQYLRKAVASSGKSSTESPHVPKQKKKKTWKEKFTARSRGDFLAAGGTEAEWSGLVASAGKKLNSVSTNWAPDQWKEFLIDYRHQGAFLVTLINRVGVWPLPDGLIEEEKDKIALQKRESVPSTETTNFPSQDHVSG